ncbi:transporter substrate-binding domain-containing protein [Gallaecimonas sp. GXIMD4217]|uniref:substrate-binding periplasmic protein n=1 Tax=Gallaecimonas sp. GXIMD4217 TaxID=3131927 RepID=UPI00311B38E4
MRLRLCSLLLLPWLAWAKPLALVIQGDQYYPPYSYLQDGQFRGIYVDLLKVVFAEMPGYQVELQPMPWKRGLRMLELGDSFALFPPYLHLKERPWIGRYSAPMLEEEVAVFCRDDVVLPDKPAFPDDFQGLTFGINSGFALGGEAFRQAVAQGWIRLEAAHSNQSNLLKMVLHRIDCYINDRRAILFDLEVLEEQGWPMALAGIGQKASVSREMAYLAFSRYESRYPYRDAFVEEFNRVLAKVKARGELDRIVASYLNGAAQSGETATGPGPSAPPASSR